MIIAISGAAHGIGRATALRMAQSGRTLALMDLDGEALADTTDDCVKQGARCQPYRLDLTEYDAIVDCFESIHRDLGPVDTLINNVGRAPRERFQEFHESGPDLWRFIIDSSLTAAIACSRQVVGSMRDRRNGRIVSVSSEAAFTGGAGSVEYAAAKAGIIGFTRALAKVMAPYDSTVNVVCPGATNTRAVDQWSPQVLERATQGIPLGRMAEASEIAATIAFLASEDAAYITGQTIVVNGGRYMH